MWNIYYKKHKKNYVNFLKLWNSIAQKGLMWYAIVFINITWFALLCMMLIHHFLLISGMKNTENTDDIYIKELDCLLM